LHAFGHMRRRFRAQGFAWCWVAGRRADARGGALRQRQGPRLRQRHRQHGRGGTCRGTQAPTTEATRSPAGHYRPCRVPSTAQIGPARQRPREGSLSAPPHAPAGRASAHGRASELAAGVGSSYAHAVQHRAARTVHARCVQHGAMRRRVGPAHHALGPPPTPQARTACRLPLPLSDGIRETHELETRSFLSPAVGCSLASCNRGYTQPATARVPGGPRRWRAG